MLRVSATSGTSNKISTSSSAGLLTAQSAFSLVGVFRLNTTTSAYDFLCGRGATNASLSLRNWAILCDSGSGAGGSTNRLRFAWCRGGTEEGGDSNANGAIVNSRINQLVFTFNGTDTVRCYLNGVMCFDKTVTGPPNNNAYAFTWGCDPGVSGIGGPLDLAEWEATSEVLTQAQVTALMNNWSPAASTGSLKRLRDIGITPTNYWDMLGNETSTITDKAGSLNGTGSSITVPVSTYLDHPPMWAPIAEFAAPDTTCYDATSGGSLVANNGNVSRWEDTSGRKLHLTVASAGHEPVLRSGATDYKPSVFFDKFDSSWSPQATGLTISGVRLNPGAFSVAGVYSARGWRADLNGVSGNNPGAFNTVWSVDGNTSPSTRLVLGIDTSGSEYSTGILRTPNAANSGTVPVKGSDGTPSGQLFAPTSPSFLVHSSNGTDIFVGLNDLSSANSATLTQAYAAANTTGGIVVGRNPSNVNFNFDGALYTLKFYNRAITQAERESLRDTWAAAGYFTKSPTELWFGMGSSSMWGQQAAYGRELFHFLWHTKPQARNAWIYNYGSPRARLDVDSVYTTTTDNTVPKHDTHALDTIDIVQGLFPSLPVRLVTWAGINDIAGAAGAPTAAQTAADTLTKLNTYLDNRITAIGASRIRQSVVFTVWVNSDMAGAELTERTDFNAALFTDAGFGTNWRKVIDLRSTVLDDMTTAGSTYTSDSKHPNETAFSSIIGPAVAAKLLHEAGARQCRARCLCRATSPLDYATS